MMGSLPRPATPIRFSVRVSSRVDLTPRRADTAACTRSSTCSSMSVMPLSVLAKAHDSLPVFRLVLVGGSTPNRLRYSANLSLDMSMSCTACAPPMPWPRSWIKVRLRVRTSSRCLSSSGTSSSITGSVYILSVWSITNNSLDGKPTLSLSNSALVMFTSFLQYSPY